MPTILREAGLRFHFFSADGHEPPHVHVDGDGTRAKVWLNDARFAKRGDFNEADLKRILMIVQANRQLFWRLGMNSSVEYPENERPVEAWCDLHELHVRLLDGRKVSTPLWWYPRLLKATPAQRNNVELMLDGVHWPDVDEDLSVDGMLKGRKAPGAVAPSIAAE